MHLGLEAIGAVRRRLKRLRVRWTRHLRNTGPLGFIDNLSIWGKSFAAFSILLLCLIALGVNAYLGLERAASGLAQHARIELPKQRTAAALTRDILATHLKIFRYVALAQIGVDGDGLRNARSEILGELGALRDRLRLLKPGSPQASTALARAKAVSDQWNKYTSEIGDVLSAAATDPAMASMLFGATDDEFQGIAGELQSISSQIAEETKSTSLALAAQAAWSRDLLALGGALGIIISALVTLYVGRSILTPIRAITRAMQQVSSNRRRIELGYRRRRDEIGQMAEAITAFQTTMEQKNKLLADHQDELAIQNVRFEAAMNHMSQGLAMFDAGQRLVVCNRLYADIYGLTLEQVRPGTSLRQLLRYRHAKGLFGDVEFESFADAWLAQFSASSSRVQELADGRAISIIRRPMPDGGVVSTTEDITDRRRSEAKIAHMARHDALTDLPNRVLLKERLELAVARAQRGEIVAVHLLDLDHFKNVNDTLGHPIGDVLLKSVTDRLRALLRETDTIARMGGDEFAIVQVGLRQPADASGLAQRLIEIVSAPYDIDGHQVVASTSVGIAIGPTDGNSPDQLIRNADLALYRAKADGRGVFRFFEPEMDARMQARRVMEYDLRRALTAGEFELHYQPLVNLSRNAVSGCEALIRWRHPEKGMISPADFIPLAEENGFIVPLGEWAIRTACATAANWPPQISIAVNLSPAQFRSPGLVQVVVAALAASGLEPRRLELEITETVLLEDSAATLATLHQLRALGVRVAMDDFGTGYSSLSYLQSFPFDKIKIDRSFIKEVAERKNAVDIVRAVAALAQGLGMSTTAEGVETAEQLATVKAEGCTEMQGFVFSQARPAHEIEALFFSKVSAVEAVASAA